MGKAQARVPSTYNMCVIVCANANYVRQITRCADMKPENPDRGHQYDLDSQRHQRLFHKNEIDKTEKYLICKKGRKINTAKVFYSFLDDIGTSKVDKDVRECSHAAVKRQPIAVFSPVLTAPSALFRPCLRPSERVPARSVPLKPPPAAPGGGRALHSWWLTNVCVIIPLRRCQCLLEASAWMNEGRYITYFLTYLLSYFCFLVLADLFRTTRG